MAAVFGEDGTHVRIVIVPTYDRKAMNAGDVEWLRGVFGAARVFDFSGPNRFTNDIHSFYEPAHFRVHVARSILDIVYRGRQAGS